MKNDKFFRRLDGSNNNEHHPEWGASNTQLLRVAPASYGDGKSSLAIRVGAGDNTGDIECPNPRLVSNQLCSQTSATQNSAGLSDFVWAWGQFIDHEIDLTEGAAPEEKAPIHVDKNDPHFVNGGIIPFKRSAYALTTGFDEDNPRQQVNQLSSFIDGANIYGVDEERLTEMRSCDGSGKMRVTKSKKGDLLPYNTAAFPNAMAPDDADPGTFFLSGDIRANEHGILTAMHTLFVREHNRLCDKIVRKHPILIGKDDEIFQLARKLVGAIMQVITYKEFIPALLGKNALSKYKGYCDDVNPGIANVFSTACYRLGHSMLPDTLDLGDKNGEIKLRNIFFSPSTIVERGIEPLLQGRYQQRMQEIDLKITDEVRNFLFSPPNPEFQPFLDLAALNIQRGRDHGLADYNSVREAYGLARVTTFSEITCDTEIQDKLEILYRNVDNIDPWIGGLAEDHKEGAQVGEMIFSVLKDQFERMRDGDRFWYKNDPILQNYQSKLKTVTLAKVIKRNTSLKDMPKDVFRARRLSEN